MYQESNKKRFIREKGKTFSWRKEFNHGGMEVLRFCRFKEGVFLG
jgi:hypothetical protein